MHHSEMPKLNKQHMAYVAVCIIAFIYLVLTAAEVGLTTSSGNGLPQRCALQFPKWFGCVLTNHENLAGGLIGAGGTIFAAWLAWAALDVDRKAARYEQLARQRSAHYTALVMLRPLKGATIALKTELEREHKDDQRLLNAIRLFEPTVNELPTWDVGESLSGPNRMLFSLIVSSAKHLVTILRSVSNETTTSQIATYWLEHADRIVRQIDAFDTAPLKPNSYEGPIS